MGLKERLAEAGMTGGTVDYALEQHAAGDSTHLLWHDEIPAREPLSPDLGSSLHRRMELAFIDGHIEEPIEEPDRFLAHVLAILEPSLVRDEPRGQSVGA